VFQLVRIHFVVVVHRLTQNNYLDYCRTHNRRNYVHVLIVRLIVQSCNRSRGKKNVMMMAGQL